MFYARRGHGPVRIQQALRQKGVSDALRARAFACFFEEGGSWLQSCYAAWNKRFGCYPDGAAAYQKQQRFLSHRGFDHETIRATLSASFQEA